MTPRESFEQTFGPEQTRQIEFAAESHMNGAHSNKGSDPFKWALCIVIGYKCVEKSDYAAGHAITIQPDDFKQFCREHAELSTHDGDVDYLALFTGAYEGFL